MKTHELSRTLKRASQASSRTLVAAGFVACASCSVQRVQAPAPELPDPGADGEYQVALPQPPPPAVREIGIDLVADLKHCDVDEPHFFYDEAKPRPQAMPELEGLARCLQRDEYSEISVLLVGRTDAEGPKEYNAKLAKKRAEFVKDQLVQHGVPEERITTMARGEADAVGQEPWASDGYDRRVDIIQLSLVEP